MSSGETNAHSRTVAPDDSASGALDTDSILVAMTLVPRAYSRNKMFELFRRPDVRSARARAATLRGVVRQLTRHRKDRNEEIAVSLRAERPSEPQFVLSYEIPSLALRRRLELTTLESICVRFLLGRAGVAGFELEPADRDHLNSAIARLSGGFAGTVDRERF